jgi:hypothetical protein
LTFIILARSPSADAESCAKPHVSDEVDISTLPMVGDVNLFLKGTPPHLRTGIIPRNPAEEEEEEFEAELEIMIAGTSHNSAC